REPYRAAADAPFNTDILSIFSGSKSPRPFPISESGFQNSAVPPLKLFMGTPSTTIKGWLSPVKELFPLKTILEELAGPLLPLITCRPATLPERALERLVSRDSTKSPPFISCKAYPNDFFSLLIPKAVTTTSPNCSASSSMETLMADCPPTTTSLVLKPKEEKTNVAELETLMV